MTDQPTIADLRREARELFADQPGGGFALMLIRKLDAMSDGERHYKPAGCGHLFEAHGKHGCTLCSTCRFVPVNVLAKLSIQQAAEQAYALHGCHECPEIPASPEDRQESAHSEPQADISHVGSHDCVTDNDWPDDAVTFEGVRCSCGSYWTNVGEKRWVQS